MPGVPEADPITVGVREVQGIGKLVGWRWYQRMSARGYIPGSSH